MARLQPNVYIEIQLAKYPASLGTTVYRWARYPMADAGSWKEQRLISISPISRQASDLDGNYFISSVSALLNDQDGVLRGLLESGASTEYWSAREATVYLISETGRGVVDPRPIFRGLINDVQVVDDRQIRLELADVIGSQFSAFNLDKTIGNVFIRDIDPDAEEDLRDVLVPIYAGEFSDLDSKDVNGATAEKGLCPVFDLGDKDLSGATPTTSTVPKVAPPYDLRGEVVGAGGDVSHDYFASVITPYGESTVSAKLHVSGAADVSQLGIDNYVAIRGKFDRGPNNQNKVRIWGRGYSTPTTYLDEAFYSGSGKNAEFFYNDGSHPAPTPTRADVDREKKLSPPKTNTAVQSDDVWARLLVCLGYNYEILDVFASNLVKDKEPKRVKLDDSEYGTTVIRPSDPEWPHADPWIEENDIRYTAIYARGPIVNAHRDGSITIAVTLCGPHDDSDNAITQAGPAYQWLLNEHVLKNGGTGYRSGDYGPLEEYANGDSMLWTSKFEDFQDATKAFLGDSVGYPAQIHITEPTTVREIIRRSALSHGMRWAHNHFGQVFPFVISDLEALSTGRHFRRYMEISRPVRQTLAHDEVRNKEAYVFHFDPDASDFRFKGFSQKNDDSIAAHTPGGVIGTSSRLGVREGDGEREMYYVNDPPTAHDVIARGLAARARRPRYLAVPSDLTALEYDITSSIRITDQDGLGSSGDVETPAIVIGVEIDTEKSEVILLTQEHKYVNRSRKLSAEGLGIADTVQVSGLLSSESVEVSETIAALMTSFTALTTSAQEALIATEIVLRSLIGNLSVAVDDERVKGSETFGSGIGVSVTAESLKLAETVTAFMPVLAVSTQESLRLADTVSTGDEDMLIVKTADETVNNSVTLQNDDELSFTATANKTYLVDLYLLLNGGITADYKFAWSLPSGAWYWGAEAEGGGGGISIYWVPKDVSAGSMAAISSSTLSVSGSANTPQGLHLTTTIAIGGSGGTVNLQWAQNTQTVADTKVLAKSVMRVTAQSN